MQTTILHRKTEPFWDRIAPKYAQKPISDLPAYEEKLAVVRGLLHPEDRILEIGCGTGSTALRLAQTVSHVTASDISSRMIEIAQSKIGETRLSNVSFQQADAARRFGTGPFDAVCAFSLLHLVDDLQQVLGSVYQQLKPGGLFLSKTVCLKDGPYPIRLFVRVLTAMGVAPRVTALSRTELIRQLKCAGFEIESASHFGKQHTNPFIVGRRPTV